jgi:hypothetical protein
VDTLGEIRSLAFDFFEAGTQGHVAQMQFRRCLLAIATMSFKRHYDLFVCRTIG